MIVNINKVLIMNRQQLLEKIKVRREALSITVKNLAILSKLGEKTLYRFFDGDDVKLSTIEKLTQTLGLDFAGNEEFSIELLKEQRALKKATYIVGLVQDTSSLENQGLDKIDIDRLINKTKHELLYGKYQNTLWST